MEPAEEILDAVLADPPPLRSHRKPPTGPYAKKLGVYHTNQQTVGACHYYRARSGQRLIFRQNEIKFVEPTPAGAIVETIWGCEYKVTCPRPELVVPGEEPTT